MAHFPTAHCPSTILSLIFTSKFTTSFASRRNKSSLFLKSYHSNFQNNVLAVNPRIHFLTHLRASPSNSSPESSENDITDEWGEKAGIADEWGEKGDVGPEIGYPKQPQSDPPTLDDEWKDRAGTVINDTPNTAPTPGNFDKIRDLKNYLVDTFYGTECGFRASPEVRGEVSELVQQLEAINPCPTPAESPSLLDGTWVLLYTAYSELLPLLAISSIPLLKVEKITQVIDSSKLSIINATTLSSPVAKVSFNAAASFTVRSPTRIQVEFKEGSFLPPEISSTLSLPESVNLFGQNLNLSPIQQTLNPLQEAAASISKAISGQQPLKIPISNDRAKSWLLITYLDEELRICRGDGGGIFILAKEGSSLID